MTEEGEESIDKYLDFALVVAPTGRYVDLKIKVSGHQFRTEATTFVRQDDGQYMALVRGSTGTLPVPNGSAPHFVFAVCFDRLTVIGHTEDHQKIYGFDMAVTTAENPPTVTVLWGMLGNGFKLSTQLGEEPETKPRRWNAPPSPN